MRLVHIESNLPRLFGPIVFNDGLNVIFAKVKDPRAQQRSAHNLGKSFLMDVIDFALGGDLNKDHPFRKRDDLFQRFEFTLQLRTNRGQFVSVRRPVQGRAACSILFSSTRVPVASYPNAESWTEMNLGLDDFKKRIDSLVDLDDLRPYTYRKGLGYQLRGQLDYGDEFRISRFAKGHDRDWRPFVAQLLGFRSETFLKSYDLEERAATLQKTIAELEGTDQRHKDQYDEVRGEIEIREAEVTNLRQQLERFEFTGVEREVNRQLVEEIEAALAELNERRYLIDRDLQDIQASLAASFDFDFSLVQRVYQSAKIELPDLLVKDFDQLLSFTRRISSDRSGRLEKLRSTLEAERQTLEGQAEQLDMKRQAALHVLREAESFAKYRRLTDHVLDMEAGLRGLRERMAQLSQAALLRAELTTRQKDVLDAQAEVAEVVRAPNPAFTSTRGIFNTAVREILGARAVLSVVLNKAHHPEFKTAILEGWDQARETYEGEGTSYKKILCACVDLALLQAHSTGSYYRFVYHDGVFEGLDNRRKVALLQYVRRTTEKHAFQYILTVIDSDLPRDERDQKLLFSPEEVILNLHDSGDDGRLFRMQRF